MNIAVELDTQYPTFITSLLLGSSLKRQVTFVALAALTRDSPEDLASRLRLPNPADDHIVQNPHERIARALMIVTRAREVIQAVFGEVPNGFLRVLTRIGADPLPDPGLYFILFDMFANPQNRVRRDVLHRHGEPVTATQIEIVRCLDPVLVHENLLKRLQTVSEAEDANAALALIRNTVSSATEDAIRQSIEKLGDKTDLATFFNRWLAKMDRPPACPLIPENDPEVAVMTSGEAMASLGRRFRNCATTRIVYAAIGFEVLLEWRLTPGLIAQCRRLTDGQWVLTELHARGNGRVEPTAAAEFRRKLAALGIPALSPSDMFPRTSGILTLVGMWHGGLGNNLGFDDEDDDLDEDIAEVVNVT